MKTPRVATPIPRPPGVRCLTRQNVSSLLDCRAGSWDAIETTRPVSPSYWEECLSVMVYLGWWCWGSCEGQEGSSGTCHTRSTTCPDSGPSLVRRAQTLFSTWGLDQNSSVAGWLISHSPPAALKAVSHGHWGDSIAQPRDKSGKDWFSLWEVTSYSGTAVCSRQGKALLAKFTLISYYHSLYKILFHMSVSGRVLWFAKLICGWQFNSLT